MGLGSDAIMTALVTTPVKSQEQPSFCLFPPVANSVSHSLLQLKLRMQLNRQSHLVPPAPITSEQALKGLVTQWTSNYIADLLFMEMCEYGPIVDEPGILSKKANGGKINYFYLEAARYAGRISVGNFDGANAKYKPVFEIHYKHFTTRLQEELQALLKDSPGTLANVVQNAVFHIFRARHKRIFYDYIQNEGLNWRFVAD
jgi:hypothetical protein